VLVHILENCVVENISDRDNQQCKVMLNKSLQIPMNVLWLWTRW